MSLHIFVVGLDDFNRRLLETVKNARDYRFHGLLDYAAVVNPPAYDIESMLNRARAELKGYGAAGVAAIIGHWDFPAALLVALLQRELGLRGARLENVMIAEHKYWCRLRQRRAVPEVTPAFQALDPFAGNPGRAIELDYPFWIKPVIAFSSQLAYRVNGDRDLQRALADIRRGIDRFGRPFDSFLHYCKLPDDIPAGIDAYHCIVEQPIGGHQCTLEGYIRHGKSRVYAIVDSFREGRYRSCFSRYQYPSRLPAEVQRRMIDAACPVIEALGLDDTPFNVEFYWNRSRDRIWLLEVNTRISKSHSPLFALVDGASQHEVAIDVALDRQPDFPRRAGRFPLAAKFMLRRHSDGVVTRVPTAAELEALHRAFPGSRIQIAVHAGQRLAAMRGQDAYSYEVAVVFTGARNQKALLEKGWEIRRRLPLAFDDGQALEAAA